MSSYSQKVPLHAIKTKEMGPLGFGIIDLSARGGKAYDSSVPHRHTFFELLIFTEAVGEHEIDFTQYKVEVNSVHFVSPGQIHHLELRKNKGYVICFTEEFISLSAKESFTEAYPFYDSSNPPVLKLSKALGQQVLELATTLFEEHHAEGNDALEICRSYLNILLLKLRSAFQQNEKIHSLQTDKNHKVMQFKKQINVCFLVHKSVSDYAEELSVSPNHLNALCKKQEGKTASQLIQERVLLESKRLLYATDMHIKEICFYLQFEDVPYFNRFFKKQTRLTPIAYRQLSQKKSLKSTSLSRNRTV